MASREQIDELVSQKAFEQVERLTAELKNVNDEFVQTVNRAKQFTDTLAGANGLKELNKAAADASKEIDKLNKVQLQSVTVQQKLNTEKEKTEKQIMRETLLREKNLAAAAKQQSAYQLLSKELDQQRAAAKDLAIIYGENSKQFLDAAKNVNILDTRLKNIDKTLGQSQRFVGEYERGNRGLSNSINELTREFPAFAVSAQTGFLALSNNIPIFFDEIKKTTDSIKALRAQGEKVPGLLTQLAKSFFSWGTVLSIGVTLLTVYGKEIGAFVSGLFKGKEAVDAFAERQKALNDLYKTSNKDAGEQISRLKILYAAATDVTNSTKERVKAVKELKKEFPDTFEAIKTETVLNGGAKKSYEELTAEIIKNARARAAATKLAEIEGKRLDLQLKRDKINYAKAKELSQVAGDVRFDTGLGTGTQVLTAEVQRQNIIDRANIAQTEVALNDKILKEQADFLTKYVGGESVIASAITPTAPDPKVKKDSKFQAQLEFEKEALESALKFEGNSLDQRLMAVDEFRVNSLKIIQAGEDAKTYTLQEAITLRKQISNDVAEAENNTLKQAYDAQVAYAKTVAEAEKEIYENSKTTAEQYGLQQLESIQNNANDVLLALSQQYAQGLISTREYNEQRKDIEDQANLNSVQAQIDAIKLLIKIQEEFGLDVSADKKKLADLERKLSKETVDAQIQDQERLKANREAVSAKIKELALEVFEFGTELVNASFEAEKNRVQERSDSIDVQKEKEIADVERSIATEQEKADRIAIINSKAQAQKDLLDKRRREIEVRQAKFDKAVALANIVNNTYAGAARALKDYPFPFSNIIAGLVIGIGLAQAAQVIAQPIPKYAKGTEYHKGGPLIYGEAGQELVIEPSGKQYLTPDTATLSTAPKGTKVIPHHELLMALARPEKLAYSGGQAVDITPIVNSMGRVEKAIKQQRMSGTFITKKGWQRQQVKIAQAEARSRKHFE